MVGCPVTNQSNPWQSRLVADHPAPENIEHPGTGAQVAVRTKVLKLVDGTYVLEGKVSELAVTPRASPFNLTCLGRIRRR